MKLDAYYIHYRIFVVLYTIILELYLSLTTLEYETTITYSMQLKYLELYQITRRNHSSRWHFIYVHFSIICIGMLGRDCG